ncbi:DUF4434 domain-containing protein [Deefgea salmonis]|uniref:DUF4434 domain-containing protein n=1 Tax=Deefgea salmonis TaxID=2875502 RepID=A0ABS8BHV5_9NEIS|nr:DUF4434 domain-containing protein [Deefgea salmonis]MCB5195302.1 hypothetical protein [Deefgea salmonis]
MKWSVAGLVFVLSSTGLLASVCQEPQLKTIILQPWQSQSEVTPANARRINRQLDAQGFGIVLLQWSRNGQAEFWPSDGSGWLQNRLLRDGRRSYIMGLYSDPGFFKALHLPDNELDAYLSVLREFSLAEAKKIITQSKVTIVGWYLPEEIDDLNWRTPERQAMLVRHYQAISRDLKVLRPDLPVYASSFFGGFSTPKEYAAMLRSLQQQTGIQWMVQGGQGVLRKPQPATAAYLKAVNAALPRQQWSGILEVFTEKNSPKAQRFCPALLSEIQKRKVVWCAATGASPAVYFSLNQLSESLFGIPNTGCKSEPLHGPYHRD